MYSDREDKRKGVASGVLLAIGTHVVMATVLLTSGLDYLDPPPPEESFVIDFTQEEEAAVKQKPQKATTTPRVPNPDRTRSHELVQASQAPNKGSKPNQAPESTVGQDGDVDIKEPPREEPIDNRSLFPTASNSKKDTLAPQTAYKVEDKLKPGHPEGNTVYGKIEGDPNGVKGRTIVNGNMPRPNYPVQEEGTVVVSVKVNQYGKVIEAVPGAPGTTTMNTKLHNEARKAALKTQFNSSANAPVIQEGTITYIFKLKAN